MKSKTGNLIVLGMLLCVIVFSPGYKDIAATVSKLTKAPVVVLDPGHGGIDGGAESRDGTNEKDINLSIAVFLKAKLEDKNIKVIMTRSEDKGLYDDSQEGAIRSLKTQDMKERKNIIDEADADLTVSIHLNSFTQDPQVKGAQVFYPQYGDDDLTQKSEEAAKLIQKNLNQDVNGTKPRTELAKGDVYLLENISCPIVIVECGFLSNSEDAENLREEKHQRDIADVLSKSVCGFLDKNSAKK